MEAAQAPQVASRPRSGSDASVKTESSTTTDSSAGLMDMTNPLLIAVSYLKILLDRGWVIPVYKHGGKTGLRMGILNSVGVKVDIWVGNGTVSYKRLVEVKWGKVFLSVPYMM